MEERNVIDVTSFLLFESIGDSDEANSNMNVYDPSSSQENVSMDEVDDAQSCSDFTYPNDLCDFDHDDREHIIVVVDDDRHHGYDEDHHVMNDDDDDEEEDVIDQEWSSCENLLLQKKSKVCNDFSKMNERDKDRHFWETCLAS